MDALLARGDVNLAARENIDELDFADEVLPLEVEVKLCSDDVRDTALASAVEADEACVLLEHFDKDLCNKFFSAAAIPRVGTGSSVSDLISLCILEFLAHLVPPDSQTRLSSGRLSGRLSGPRPRHKVEGLTGSFSGVARFSEPIAALSPVLIVVLTGS